jgi:hypothetical protein
VVLQYCCQGSRTSHLVRGWCSWDVEGGGSKADKSFSIPGLLNHEKFAAQHSTVWSLSAAYPELANSGSWHQGSCMEMIAKPQGIINHYFFRPGSNHSFIVPSIKSCIFLQHKLQVLTY